MPLVATWSTGKALVKCLTYQPCTWTSRSKLHIDFHRCSLTPWLVDCPTPSVSAAAAPKSPTNGLAKNGANNRLMLPITDLQHRVITSSSNHLFDTTWYLQVECKTIWLTCMHWRNSFFFATSICSSVRPGWRFSSKIGNKAIVSRFSPRFASKPRLPSTLVSC